MLGVVVVNHLFHFGMVVYGLQVADERVKDANATVVFGNFYADHKLLEGEVANSAVVQRESFSPNAMEEKVDCLAVLLARSDFGVASGEPVQSSLLNRGMAVPRLVHRSSSSAVVSPHHC